MLRAFGTRGNCLRRTLTCTGESGDPIMVPAESLWVDLYEPTAQEREAAKAVFGFEPPTREDMEEIEISNVSLQVLQSIFGEPEAEPMYAVYPIKPRHAKALQRYISVPFDIQKFDYFLEAEEVK